MSNHSSNLFIKGLKYLKDRGFRYTLKKVRIKFQVWFGLDYNTYSPSDLQAQRETVFDRDILISIIVPLYNTPVRFLTDMINSVIGQTYSNWELCLADGSDNSHCEVGEICEQYAKNDKRILYRKLEKNEGISGNTNAAIDMATGDYIALFDHDDFIHPAALYEIMKAICDKNADFVYTDEIIFKKRPEKAEKAHFKPDFAPDTLRSINYICHFSVFSKDLMNRVGKFDSSCDGSQDFDMILRLTEKAEKIVHIPKPLYCWRMSKNSTASSIDAKPYTVTAGHRALQKHLESIGLKGEVLDSSLPTTYRIKYEINGEPLISIVIPNKDHIDDLDKCIRSIKEKTTYKNWEIIVVENNSENDSTFEYYKTLESDQRIKIVKYQGVFNYSAINNFGANFAKGEYLLLLNNDTEVITPDWLQEMLMFNQRSDVGAVGAMLYYEDDTIQHAGVIVGIGGCAGHQQKGTPKGDCGYLNRLSYAQNLSAVTAACMMVKRSVWDHLNGLDEDFVVALNDVDFCLRIRKAGYLIVWTPYAELYHYESKSRGYEDTPEKKQRFANEVKKLQSRWADFFENGDPYYNVNLTLEKEDFSLRIFDDK